MSDACYICQTEAVDTEDWYFNEKSHEYVCPWCVRDLISIRKILGVEYS